MDIRSFFSDLLGSIPEKVILDFELADLEALIPTQPDILSSVKYLALFSAGFTLLGFLGRVFCGKRSSLNHAVSSAVGIVFIYALTAFLYTLKPLSLDEFLSPLPFVAFSGEYMRLFPLIGAHFSVICYEVLGMLILAFLMNLLGSLLPEGDSVIGWFFMRLLCVVLAMAAHLLVRWLFSTYLPDVLALYAPVIVLCVLAGFLLLGALNFILGLVLTATNPILGAIYAFFFSNLIGKQLTKAVLTTVILTVLVILLEYFGIGLILITQAALIAYIPAILVLLVIWYLVGYIL